MRKRVRWCGAKLERLKVLWRDRLFAQKDGRRYRFPQRMKSRCSKLFVGEEIVQDTERLLKVWANHFLVLSESRLGVNHGSYDEKIRKLEATSYGNEEHLLDVPFTSKEVFMAVSKLKKKKSPGPDSLLAEHLKAGGGHLLEEYFEYGQGCSGWV